jgi:hypothetical protein
MRTPLLLRTVAYALLLGMIANSAYAAGLKVSSATLEANPERLVVKLVNDSPVAVTAWGINILVTRNGNEVSYTGYSEDRLESVLNDRLASTLDERPNKAVRDLWGGAITSRSSYEKLLPTQLPADLSASDPALTVRVTLKGAIYADGKIDTADPEGTMMMQQIKDHRAATARTETKISAIFTEYAGDRNTPRRFEEIRQAITTETSQAQTGSGSLGYNRTEFQRQLQNLDHLQKSDGTQLALDRYTTDLTDRHRLRMELLQPMRR